jgi:hypothetical protein
MYLLGQLLGNKSEDMSPEQIDVQPNPDTHLSSRPANFYITHNTTELWQGSSNIFSSSW